MQLLRRLTTATAVSTLLLVAIGGVVRATGSGDACPDWPTCFGRLIPPLDLHTLIEYSHRLAAVTTSVLVIATAWVAWRRAPRGRGLLWPWIAAVPVILVQAAIGGIVVLGDLKPAWVTLHFAAAMALLGLVLVGATAARVDRAPAGSEAVHGAVRWSLIATAALLLVGAYVRGENAGLVFLDWPLMDGRFIPDLSTGHSVASFLHRLLAAAAVLAVAVFAVRARRTRGSVRTLAWITLGLLLMQTGLGAAAVFTRLAPWARAAHVAGASLTWAALVVVAATVWRPAEERGAPTGRARARVAAFAQLAKPDIILLLLITTVPAMILAAGGMPPAGLLIATLFGGTLAAAGANAINCYLDRDIDEVMARTRGRPLPTHRIEPREALWFGSVLVGAAFLWLIPTVNLLAASLTLAAAAFYVLIYTRLLKRSTPQNIVIGGAAGAVPALVGWAAVTGRVELPAIVLFGIIFLWTPPHFWALALRHSDEYRTAGIPMLPAVRGPHETALRIVGYSVVLVVASLALLPVAGLGAVYLVTALTLGGTLMWFAVQVLRSTQARAAMAMFRFSITYLALLFAAVAIDVMVS